VKFTGGIAAAVFASALMAEVACAGDIASFRTIGFSPDGSVFAFEE
jgi:predicted secreted protein